jgi:ADP-ribosylglycohydrolase
VPVRPNPKRKNLILTHPIIPDYVLPALVADSLCLGAHWIYDAAQIARIYPQGVTQLDAPHSSYHPGKAAGDFTHYGDQTLALLRSIVSRGGFDADGWRADWSAFWAGNTHSYRDGATRLTLERLAHGFEVGAESQDLGGASRLAPLLASLALQPLEQRILAAKAQTQLTHNSALVLDAAAFITLWVDALQQRQDMEQSLIQAAAADCYQEMQPRIWLEQVQAAAGLAPRQAGELFGLSCHVNGALPLTAWLALTAAKDPKASLQVNATLGGDSAARGLVLGLVLGCAEGRIWLPTEWQHSLCAATELDRLLGLSDAPAILV